MCLNRGSLDSIFSSPPCNGRIRLCFVAFWSGHPRARLKIEFADELPILANVAVQRRMIGLVHGDLEAVYGPFRHVRLTEMMLSRDNKQGKRNCHILSTPSTNLLHSGNASRNRLPYCFVTIRGSR